MVECPNGKRTLPLVCAVYGDHLHHKNNSRGAPEPKPESGPQEKRDGCELQGITSSRGTEEMGKCEEAHKNGGN